MMNTSASAAGQKARYFLVVPLLALALGFSAAQAQPAVPAQPQMAVASDFAAKAQSLYFIDGQPASRATADALDPKFIASMEVLNGETAQQLYHEAGADGVVVIVTTANQKLPAVLALNKKLASVAPIVPGTETPNAISGLMPAALAYITKNYPDSRITDVKRLDYPTLHTSRYKVEITAGRRPQYLFFDEKGNLVDLGSTPK